MNADNLRALADLVEIQPDTRLFGPDEPGVRGFCMVHTHHECGAPACLQGWAKVLSGDASTMQFLDLTDSQSSELYLPSHPYAYWHAYPGEPGHVSSKHAAAVLRHAAETDEIDWSVRPTAT